MPFVLNGRPLSVITTTQARANTNDTPTGSTVPQNSIGIVRHRPHVPLR